MHRGFVKLWRRVMDSGIIQDGPLLQVFTKGLLEAAHEPCRVRVGRQTIELQPGQFVFGRNRWASDLGLGTKAVRAKIEKLQKWATIAAIQRANEFTVYQFVNWDTYAGHVSHGGQPEGQAKGQPGANHGPHLKNLRIQEEEINPHTPTGGGVGSPGGDEQAPAESPQAPVQPGRKRKPKPDYVAEFNAFWESYPRSDGKDAAMSKWESLRNDPSKGFPDLHTILIELERQKRSQDWAKEGGKYIPHARTWLHQGRWRGAGVKPGALPMAQSQQTTPDFI